MAMCQRRKGRWMTRHEWKYCESWRKIPKQRLSRLPQSLACLTERSKVKNDADKIRERYGLGNPKTRDSRKRTVSNIKEPFEREMYQWISELTSRKVELPPSLVMQRARVKAFEHGFHTFKASTGWFYRFMGRYGLTCSYLHGEGGEIDENDPALVQALN
ncbi:unnamed protein product, partial [Aphanomyces euteiches]